MATACIKTSAVKILPPPFSPPPPDLLREAGGRTVSLLPHSTLSHSALIVQAGGASWVMLHWEVGEVFFTDSIHCSWCSAPSPETKRKPMRQPDVSVLFTSLGSLCDPCKKPLDNTLNQVCNNSFFLGRPCLRLVWEGPVSSYY